MKTRITILLLTASSVALQAAAPNILPSVSELKQQPATWRTQTRDPLPDAANLQRLQAEVVGLKKQEAEGHAWGYPDSFVGKEPAETNTPTKKKEAR